MYSYSIIVIIILHVAILYQKLLSNYFYTNAFP